MGMPQEDVIHTINTAKIENAAAPSTVAATEEKIPVVAPAVDVESTTATNTEGKVA